MLSSPNSSISELHVCKLNILSPLIPSPSPLHFSPALPPSVLQLRSPWFTGTLRTYSFLVRSVKNGRCSKCDIFYEFDIFTAFFLKLIQFYCWKNCHLLYKKTLLWKWQHFSLGGKVVANPLQKKTRAWHEVIIFTWAAYSVFPFFFLTEVNFISSRIKQFLG